MSSPLTARRIITGHDADGKAIFTSDEVLTSTDPTKNDGTPADEHTVGFILVHRTTGIPAKVQGSVQEYNGKMINLVDNDSVTCRIVDFPSVDATFDIEDVMHRTISLDYGVVLKGTIECVLDDGAVKTVNEGDVVVQRGTNHGWRNTSGKNCRMLFVLTPSEKVKVENSGEVLEEKHIRKLGK